MAPERSTPSARQLTALAELKAVSHPTRLRLFYALKASRSPMTATQLGEIVDESPASVSYHLRTLAAHGFVEEVASDDGDGRRRWWQASAVGYSWSRNDFDGSPGAAAAADAAKSAMLSHQWTRLSEYERTASAWGKDWIHAAFSADNIVHLTPTQTAEMYTRLQAIVEEYKTINLPDDTDDAATVMVLLHGFPTKI